MEWGVDIHRKRRPGIPQRSGISWSSEQVDIICVPQWTPASMQNWVTWFRSSSRFASGLVLGKHKQELS